VAEGGEMKTLPSTEKTGMDNLAVIGPNGPVSSGMTTMKIPEDPEVTAKLASVRAQAEKEFGKKRADEMFSERSMQMFNDSMRFSVANGAPNPVNRRKDFESQLFQQIGGNPFLIDPVAEVREADKNLPQLFEAVFQGQATWADMATLTKEQRAHWQTVVNAYHAHVKEGAVSKQQQMYRAYKYGMEQFDWEDKKYEKQEDQIRKQEIEMIKQGGKIPKFSTMMNDKGQWTVHAYNQKTGMFDDTGKIGKKSDAVKAVTIDQALSAMRFLAPTMSDNPLAMFAAGNSAGSDPNKLAAFMGTQERRVAPEYRGLFRYYMSVLFAHAGQEMSDEVGGPSATPRQGTYTPPPNVVVYNKKDDRLGPKPEPKK
jgi:hypothetical protein